MLGDTPNSLDTMDETAEIPPAAPSDKSVEQNDSAGVDCTPVYNIKEAKVRDATLCQKEEENASSTTTTVTSTTTEEAKPRSKPQKDFRGGQELWQAMLYDLLAFKVKNGHMNIKFNPADETIKNLYHWCQNQRKHYRQLAVGKGSLLNAERVKILECIGFQWNLRGDTFWNQQLEALKNYKEEFGDTMVPRRWERSKRLGEWVTDQRRQYKFKSVGKLSLLTDDRQKKLDEIGFTWSVRSRTEWSDRYQELLLFKSREGHCCVPQHYASNRALGKWVSKQREQYRYYLKGTHSFMTPERIHLLNKINFIWSAKGKGVVEGVILEQTVEQRQQVNIVKTNADDEQGDVDMVKANTDQLVNVVEANADIPDQINI